MATHSISGLSSYTQGDLSSTTYTSTITFEPIDRSTNWVLFGAATRMRSMSGSDSASGPIRPTSGLVYPRLI